jgi:hypothetical protein
MYFSHLLTHQERQSSSNLLSSLLTLFSHFLLAWHVLRVQYEMPFMQPLAQVVRQATHLVVVVDSSERQ